MSTTQTLGLWAWSGDSIWIFSWQQAVLLQYFQHRSKNNGSDKTSCECEMGHTRTCLANVSYCVPFLPRHA